MVTNNSSSFWGYIIAGVLALTGIGFFLRWYHRRRKHVGDGVVDDENDIGTSSEVMPIIDKVIVDALAQKLQSFSGNFGALQNIANDAQVDLDYADAVFTNVSQVVDIQYGDNVKEWFSEFIKGRESWDYTTYKNKASEIMNIFEKCGIKHAADADVVWGDNAAKRYNRVAMIDEGKHCKVVSPYWMIDGLVVEKGLLKALNEK